MDPICLSTGNQVALSFRFTYDHVKLLLRVHHGWEVLADPAKRHHNGATVEGAAAIVEVR